MAHYEMTIRFNAPALVAQLERRIRGVLSLVAFGLASSDLATDQTARGATSHPELPDTIFQLGSPEPAVDTDSLRDEYKRWVISCGFRECTEALGNLWEEARLLGSLARHGPTSTITVEDWNRLFIQEKSNFDRLTYPKKIAHLKALCGPNVEPALSDSILSIIVARNCIVHRQGVVSRDRDFNSDSGLTVSWVRPEIVVIGAQGERAIDALPAPVEAGETIGIKVPMVSKTFAEGERIAFGSRDLNDICLTFFFYGQQLAENLQRFIADMGIPTEMTGEADVEPSAIDTEE